MHAFIPIGRLGRHSNRRHKYELRHVLWVLQRVHGCKVAAHAAAASSYTRICDKRAEKMRAASPVTREHKTLQTEVSPHAIEALRRTLPVTPTATAAAAQHHHTSRKNDSAACWSAASNAGRALAPMPSQSKANTSLSALHTLYCEGCHQRQRCK